MTTCASRISKAAAGDVEKPFSIRMFVLKNDSNNPMNGQWQEMGQLKTHLDSFSLDATTFSHNGKRYLVWAQQNQPATYNSALWIAEMDSPTSIKEPIVAITEPTLDWEVQGYKVNEGAAVMIREGKVLLTYSASATDHRYAMGLLRPDLVTNHLDAPVALLSNKTKAGNSLQIELPGTESERDATGAKVTVTSGQQSWTRWQVGGDGFLCSNESVLDFGLAMANSIARVDVQWPSGKTQTFHDLKVNQRYLMVESDPEAYAR